jgi:hypothetical protein
MIGSATYADHRSTICSRGAIDLMPVSSPGEPGKGSKARALPWTRQGHSPWNQSVGDCTTDLGSHSLIALVATLKG